MPIIIDLHLPKIDKYLPTTADVKIKAIAWVLYIITILTNKSLTPLRIQYKWDQCSSVTLPVDRTVR
jgi:hypothetical protein